ncbi:Formin-like protein 12, partial [Dichanthelium oligosanthes]
MALFRRLFYRKPPDRLLEIADRVYVFDCCFSTETMDQYKYKNYLDSIFLQLHEQFADSSLMALNFGDEGKSLVSGTFSMYGITVKDYPCEYLGCPLLPLDIILHFLRLTERWLMLEGQQNILLMHCEKGAWPVLAFMLAGLLLYRKQYNGEQRTLDMVYKQAPKELLQILTTLNPQPSHLRYLGYICRMDDELGSPTQPIPFTLDCVILRKVPNFDGVGGCRPIIRVYGRDILTTDRRHGVVSPPSKAKKHVRRYRQADNVPVKLNVGSYVQDYGPTPRAEPQKTSPFSNSELDIGIDGSRDNKIDELGLLLETINGKKTCTSTEANTMYSKETVVKSSLGSTIDGDKDDGISCSSFNNEHGCVLENCSSKCDTNMGFNQDLSQIDNVLVKEVIISETNSPKDIQMIKEVIISEVTTPKLVLEGNTMDTELGETIHNPESTTLEEAEDKERFDIFLKQGGGDSQGDGYAAYDNGLVIEHEESSNKQKISIRDANVQLIGPTDENNTLELPLSGKSHLQSSSTSSESSSAEKHIEELHACSSNGTAEKMEGIDASFSSSQSQSSNISSVNILPEGSSIAINHASTSVNANTDTIDSSRLVLKKKPFLPLSTCSLFAPLSPRRNLLRAASTDLSFLSPLQTESKQNSVASTSGTEDSASSSVPPPSSFYTPLGSSSKISLVHPPLRPIRTVSSLPSSSFEAYIEMSMSSSISPKYQEHVKSHPLPIRPPRLLHPSMTHEKDVHSEHSEYMVQHVSRSTEDTTSVLSPSIPAAPPYSIFHIVTDDSSSSTFAEEVTCKQPLDQTTQSIHLEPCKVEKPQNETINEVVASIVDDKGHGGVPIPPSPQKLSQPREHMKPPSPPPRPPPPHTTLVPSTGLSLTSSPREHYENPPSPPAPPAFSRESFVALPPPPLPNRLCPRRKHITPPLFPPPPRENKVIHPLPSQSSTSHVIPPPPPPPLLHIAFPSPFSYEPHFQKDVAIPPSTLLEDHAIVSSPPLTRVDKIPAPPPPPRGSKILSPPSVEGTQLPWKAPHLEVTKQIPPPPPLPRGQRGSPRRHEEAPLTTPLGELGGIPPPPPFTGGRAEFDVNELESLFTIAPKTKGGSKSEGRGKSLGSKPDKVQLMGPYTIGRRPSTLQSDSRL